MAAQSQTKEWDGKERRKSKRLHLTDDEVRLIAQAINDNVTAWEEGKTTIIVNGEEIDKTPAEALRANAAFLIRRLREQTGEISPNFG